MANNQIPKWQQQMRAQKQAQANKNQLQRRTKYIIGICAIVCVVAAAVLLSILLSPKNVPPVATEAPEKTVDMTEIKASIDSMQVSDFSQSDTPTDYVKLTVQDYGELVIRLCPQTAPITVDNFKNLVSQHFYDGLTFHRVLPDFMIQGGDPEGNGSGGSSTNILGEFSQNGVQNDLTHIRGVVSMARAKAPDSASSQFFICHSDTHKLSLDGAYASFGYVIAGMDTVDAICEVSLEMNDGGELAKPITPVVISSATFVKPN